MVGSSGGGGAGASSSSSSSQWQRNESTAADWSLPAWRGKQPSARAHQHVGRRRAFRWQHTSLVCGAGLLPLLLLLYTLRCVVEVHVSVRLRPPSPAAALQRRHCRNSCYKARDGICDEGRPHRDPEQAQRQALAQASLGLKPGVSAVFCDLGTDCADCGPWVGPAADAAWSEPLGPVAFLRAANISVRLRRTEPGTTSPVALHFAYTDPAADIDVSRLFEQEGVVEVGISQVFYSLLSARCGASGPGGLVGDVGANMGWHSLLAAWLGCEVEAWEPVPAFRAFLAYNLARNGLSHRVRVRPTVVAEPPGTKQTVVVPNRGIWGTASIDGLNIDAGVPNDGELQRVEVVSESLDAVLRGRHVDLLKVDVEGAEASVLATAKGLIAAGQVDNVVLEYSPGVLERASRWSQMWTQPAMLMDLAQAGFTLLHLDDEFTRVWAPGRALSAPLPNLRHITPANLAYDLWDARTFKSGWLDPDATPFCQEMVEARLNNQGIPERLHPKSFHANIAHNTNVWASRHTQMVGQLLGRPVGIMPLATPINASWFPPPGSDEGLGGSAPCSLIAEEMAAELKAGKSAREVDDAMRILIGRRCRCTHGLPCERLAAIADGCQRRGQTPYVDLHARLRLTPTRIASQRSVRAPTPAALQASR